MGYKIDYQDDAEVLRVEITGVRSNDDLTSCEKKAWREVAKIAREKNLAKILVISNATGRYPTWDAYQINSSLEECGIQREWKIAFVNLDQDSFQEVKFAETVAVNRGFNVSVFNKQENALKWISKT